MLDWSYRLGQSHHVRFWICIFWFCPSPACIGFISAYRCCLSARNKWICFIAKTQPDTFCVSLCFHHVLAIGFILTRRQRKRQPYFSTPFLLQASPSLCLIIVPDSWALIKASHLTNNTNDVSEQKQMEKFLKYDWEGRPVPQNEQNIDLSDAKVENFSV